MNKHIILNADDFGLNEGVNTGIIKAFQKGAVRGASLMVNAPAYAHAKGLIKDNPHLDVGLHLTLTQENPLFEKKSIPSLISNSGSFFTQLNFTFRYLGGKIRLEDVSRELKAQFREAANAGIKITHVDSHNHIHIFPGILDIVISLCREFGVKYIRSPFEPLNIRYLVSRMFSRRLFLMFIINILAVNARSRISKSGLIAMPSLGFLNSGDLEISNIQGMLSILPEGVFELMVHPGEINGELLAKYGHWKYHWAKELATLLNENMPDLLKKEGFMQISYKDLANAC